VIVVVQQGGQAKVHVGAHRDTVLVRSVDTLRAVQVVEPIRVRQEGPSETPLVVVTVALVVATIALVWVTGYYARKSYRLQQDQRTADTARENARNRSVAGRISYVAYMLQRQLRSWVDEAPAVAGIVDGGDGWQPSHLDAGFAFTLVQKRTRGEHSDLAEQRVERLVTDAPEAAPQVAAAIWSVCVLFNRAMGEMNTAGREPWLPADWPEKIRKTLRAYADIARCVVLLDQVVGPELRAAEAAIEET